MTIETDSKPFCHVHERPMVARAAATLEQEWCGEWFACELCTNAVLIPSDELKRTLAK